MASGRVLFSGSGTTRKATLLEVVDGTEETIARLNQVDIPDPSNNKTVERLITIASGVTVDNTKNPASATLSFNVAVTNLAGINSITGISYGELNPFATMTAAELKEAAGTHARRCIDHMKPIWTLNNVGTTIATATPTNSSPSRWYNTFNWILSGAAAVKILADDSSQLANARRCMLAYTILIPNDPAKIEIWYWAHGLGVYGAYYERAAGINNIQVWFKWVPTSGTTYPAFASDATGSIRWDGTLGTLDVFFPHDAKPEDFKT